MLLLEIIHAVSRFWCFPRYIMNNMQVDSYPNWSNDQYLMLALMASQINRSISHIYCTVLNRGFSVCPRYTLSGSR